MNYQCHANTSGFHLIANFLLGSVLGNLQYKISGKDHFNYLFI